MFPVLVFTGDFLYLLSVELIPFLILFFSQNSFVFYRSCRGGTSFLCRQRKDAKRAQRGESCFPPLNPLQGRCGGPSKPAQEYAG